MKKILFSLLILFLMGCVPLQQIKQPVEENIGEVENLVEEGTGFVKEIVAEEYKITPGGAMTVEGIKLKVVDITPDYEILLNVDDIDYIIYETHKQEIVRGLEIVVNDKKFDPTGKNTYVILKVTKFVPGENEYLMYNNDQITVADKVITLSSVDTDTLQSILIKVNNIEKRLNKGQTENINNLAVTNVNTNPRAVTSEKYAIVKVVPLI